MGLIQVEEIRTEITMARVNSAPASMPQGGDTLLH